MKETYTPIYQDLSDWFIKTPVTEVLAYDVIGRRIKQIKISHKHQDADQPIRLSELSRWITQCRADMEIRYQTTLYNVKGIGYKVTNPKELALYTAKFFKRTIMHADRTYRLVEIVDRKMIPNAIQEVFVDTEKGIKHLSLRGKKFMRTFVNFMMEQKRKQIAEGDSNGKGKR